MSRHQASQTCIAISEFWAAKMAAKDTIIEAKDTTIETKDAELAAMRDQLLESQGLAKGMKSIVQKAARQFVASQLPTPNSQLPEKQEKGGPNGKSGGQF
jgi:hypothetical protein